MAFLRTQSNISWKFRCGLPLPSAVWLAPPDVCRLCLRYRRSLETFFGDSRKGESFRAVERQAARFSFKDLLR